MTTDSIEQRAKRGDRSKFERVLGKIAASNAEPLEVDRLPMGVRVNLPIVLPTP